MPARAPSNTGNAKARGRTKWGAMRESTRRSASAWRTRPNSKCSRYLKPPWISFDDACEVPEPQSWRSIRATRSPRRAASAAVQAP